MLGQGEMRAVQSLHLTHDMVDEFRRAFSRFDKDNDGTIGVAELGTVLRMLGENPTPSEAAAMAEQTDKDGSGAIEFAEFVQLMVPPLSLPFGGRFDRSSPLTAFRRPFQSQPLNGNARWLYRPC